MKKLILFIIATIVVMTTGAQTMLYQNDSIKIIGDTTSMWNYSTSIINYDNDGNWANLNGKIVNYNDTLGIIKSFPADNYEYKYENKFYNIHVEWKYTYVYYNDSTAWSHNKRSIDSMYLSVYNNGIINNHTLPDLCDYSDTSLDFTNIKFVMTTNHNFILSMSYKQDTIMITKLFKIDTNGNVLKSRDPLYGFYIASMDYNSTELLISNFNVPFDDYYNLTTFDQDSLTIKSNKTIPDGSIMSCINDSLVFLTDYDSFFYVYNTNTDSCKTYKLRYGNFSIWTTWGSFSTEKNKVIIVNDLNDIYLAFYTSYVTGSIMSDTSRGIDIINFDAFGNTKKVVTFNDYQPSYYKGICGLATTKDSNLIIIGNTSPIYHNNDTTNIGYIMKYSIKGYVVSIDNVDIEESNYKLYPNPISNKLNIIGDYDNIEIIDYIGKIVYNSKKSDTYDLSKLKTGYYLVKIFKDNKITLKKLIKQ